MNAGAYGGEMKDVVDWVQVIDFDGKLYIYNNDELQFGYRTSYIQGKPLIVTEVNLSLAPGNPEESKACIRELTRKRQEKQPLSLPECRKRVCGLRDIMRTLIECAGLKGYRIGDAQVSEKHAGFIVNLGEATAKDVITLIETIKQKVKEVAGVELEHEIRIVGEE